MTTQARAAAGYDLWLKDEDDDRAMSVDHAPLWDRMIDMVQEKDISRKRVLDYGCNCGGLLSRLLERRPFAQGVGVDLARQGIAQARARHPDPRLSFQAVNSLADVPGPFDLILSHEVIYLLPDLHEHARQVAAVLAPEGVYYAATGCHTANPGWPQWRGLIAQTSRVAPADYSPQDYVSAFETAGLKVTVQPFQLQHYPGWTEGDPFFPTAADAAAYYQTHKLLFRISR